MDKTPLTVQEMFRRALLAQVEMGMGEMIVGKENRRVEEPSEILKSSWAKPSLPVTDLFGGASTVTLGAPADFASVPAHYDAICTCQLCPLGQTRNKFVYGVGNIDADLMFIGEAPGRDEDLQGEPFVGRAGQLLDRILTAMGLSRQEVYIANILKCRPPENRDPLPEEVDKCLPHLHEQIRLIRPMLLCSLGRIAAQFLMKTSAPLSKMRGKWHDVEGVPMLVTYHPAALLRFPGYKKDTWEDMQVLKQRYDELKAQKR
ncbi:MAG TPA: uracil-DNA glycosylase [Candidatus Deferrimicrobium sp.]|nr:uracil-DNA glycosylase [Candidatus Deferrimicrobium sp.]